MQFTIDIKAPPAALGCLLYRETITVDMTGSSGYFSLALGAGTNTASGGYDLAKIFASTSPLTGLSGCSSGSTYTPAVADGRELVISFVDSGGSQAFASQKIEAVPFAIQAKSAETVDGFSSKLLIKADLAVNTTTYANNPLNQAQYDEFWKLILGTSTTYMTPASLGGVAVSGDISGFIGSNLSVDKIKGYAVTAPTGADNGKVLAFNTGTGWTLQAAPTAPLDSSYTAKGIIQFDTNAATSGMVYSSSGVAKVNMGTGIGQIVQLDATAKLPAIDGSQLTNIVVPTNSVTSTSILDNSITNADISSSAAIAWSKIASPTTLSGYGITDAVKNGGGVVSLSKGSFASRPAPSVDGRVYYATDTEQVFVDTGSSWIQMSSNAANLTGTLPVTSGGTGHTSMGTSNQILGVNNGQTGLEYKSLTAGSGVNISNSANMITISATGSGGTVTNVTGTAPISVVTGSTTPGISIASGSAAGQALRWDGSVWKSDFIAMTDLRSTITGASSFTSSCGAYQTLTYNSVGDIMSCSNIAIDASQISSGSLPVSNGGTGSSTLASNSLLVGNGTGALQTIAPGTAGDILTSTGSSWVSQTNLAFIKNGNNFGADATIGLNSANNLGFETNNTTRMTIDSSGNVGIGTTSPSELLEVNGVSKASYFRATNSGYGLYQSDGTTTLVTYMGSGYGVIGTESNSKLALEVDSQEKMTLLPNGNVGVGTTSPMVSLDVSSRTDSIRLPAGSSGQRPASPTNGDIRYNSTLGTIEGYLSNAWTALNSAVVGRVDITSTPYTINSSQPGVYFSYNYAVAGVINLPQLSILPDGWQITIMRKVPFPLAITPFGSDGFANGISTFDMQANNLQSVTLTKNGNNWTMTNKTDDCIVGQSCWGSGNIYVGLYNGKQYFTTPGGCTNSTTPTCSGGTDTVTKAWANSSGTTANGILTGASNNTYGAAQSASLALSYTDTDAAKFCENMTYAGNSDWYLPARQELNYLYQNSSNIDGFAYSNNYWSSTESSTTNAWYFNFTLGTIASNFKTGVQYVRCIRKF
ncbi:MAG: DUF1566 domain-containing protein [Bdellovibrionaceae bacterium]|nr:DUF1566 domain-containing protein [Pseudobdellovibrionaceae bacterium]